MAFGAKGNDRFAADALDGSFRQASVRVLRDQVEIGGNQLKLNG
jgi:hypothetical protein